MSSFSASAKRQVESNGLAASHHVFNFERCMLVRIGLVMLAQDGRALIKFISFEVRLQACCSHRRLAAISTKYKTVTGM